MMFSTEQILRIDLARLTPSSWNVSFRTNETILLDITLPRLSHPNQTTNLTIASIEANRFRSHIIGAPVHLQVDRVQAREFALNMDSSDVLMPSRSSQQYSSDVLIGHVKSEQFELNLTQSDNMHVYVQQVDSSTADLYLNSQFCTNASSLQVNLNLSNNGKKSNER
jgi:hypothetical protein